MHHHSHEAATPGARQRGIDRRAFLQTAALATSAMALSNPLAANVRPAAVPRRKVSVILFQRGGADALTLFAPTGDANYAALRPTTAVGAPGGAGSVIGLYASPLFSMHPSLAGLNAAFRSPNSRVGIVHAVGHAPYDRSHFASQDSMEIGVLDGSRIDGWINRHLQATATRRDAPVRALGLVAKKPLSLVGAYPTHAVASTADLIFDARLPDMRTTLQTIVDTTMLAGMGPQRQLAYGSARSSFDLIDHFAVLSPSTYAPANGAVYPATGLGRALRETAELVKASLGVEFVAIDQGGWDHHSSLLSRIATYAADLDQAITAFFTDLGSRSDDVVLVAMSEFGREARENGSFGADHGVGGAMIVAGGAVRGGAVHGSWPTVATASLQDGRFLAPVNDYRNVLLELLQSHMGGTAADVVFPDLAFTPLGIF